MEKSFRDRALETPTVEAVDTLIEALKANPQAAKTLELIGELEEKKAIASNPPSGQAKKKKAPTKGREPEGETEAKEE